MRKPTEYQKGWMGLMLEGRKTTLNGVIHSLVGRFVFKVNTRSFDNAVRRGWIEFKNRDAILTPTGREALSLETAVLQFPLER